MLSGRQNLAIARTSHSRFFSTPTLQSELLHPSKPSQLSISTQQSELLHPPKPSQYRRRRLRDHPPRRVLPSSSTTSTKGYLVPVAAIHIAQTIDLFPVLSAVFSARNATRQHKMFGKNSFVVELPTLRPGYWQPPRYVAVFRYGMIVALNVAPKELAEIIREIKKHHTTEPEQGLSGFERKETYGVLVEQQNNESSLDESSGFRSNHEETEEKVVTGDYCIVPELDMNGVAVICNIMAQTVALDSYNDTVDGLLANFAKINKAVTKTGSFTSTDKDFLFRTVAQNNSIFIDMISRVRIKDRSDTAWNLSKYEKIHYGMKEEFEIDDRFQHIEFKLNLIQQNAKFFLEMLQHQKSTSLEWTIVVLIVLECMLMCVEMSGNGDLIFKTLPKLVTG
jgi:uncharacterized Rmd1/YagE family protein